MFKKLILFIVASFVLVVAGVTLYLNLLDWNEHKAVIAKQFAETTGKKIDFNGAVSFKLLPSPSLEASDVEIYDNDEENNKIVLAKVKKLVASLSFGSLLQKRFNIENMTMVKPEIFVDVFDDGKINWQMSDVATAQDFTVKNVDVSFGSVMVDGAKVSIVDKKHNVNLLFNDVNAEIAAGSFFGPYRIEGSYIKNGDTRGFAFDLGKFSDSFATSVNAVITHPQSESYVRFDGTVMIKNEAVNGNLVVESKNPINFLHSMFSDINVSEKYEYPLAMSLAVKSDKDKITFSNVVIKYADSAAAGSIFIPRAKEKSLGDDTEDRKRIETAFNFTDLNMDLAVDAIGDFLQSYSERDYAPSFDFDVIADFKALKANYKGQTVRDVDVSIDFMNNILSLQNLSANFPFEGTARMKGEMFSKEKVLNYTYDVEMETLNFGQTAVWLGFDLQPISKNIYKRAAAKFTLEGTPQTIKFSPLVLNMDKTSFDAKLAIVRGDKNRYFAIIDADNISFDNYITPMPEEVKADTWKNRIDYYVKKVGFLNDLDLQLKADLKSGIWQRTPFEKAHLEVTFKDGTAKVSKFYVDELASSQIGLKGEVFGFGNALQFKNLRYSLDVANTMSFVNKFGISQPNLKWQNLPNFSSSGILTGDFDRFAMKSESKLGSMSVDYEGEISKQDDNYLFDGKLGVQADDTVKMLHDFYVNYNPSYPLGIFKLLTNVKSNPKLFLMKDMNLNIGANNFAGDVLFSNNEDGRKLIKANLNVNKFEFERFLSGMEQKDENGVFRAKKDDVPFLAKPEFSRSKINYDFMKNYDVEAKLNVISLFYKNYQLKNASWVMSIKNQVLNVVQFVAERGGGTLNTDFELNTLDQNLLKGKISLNNVRVKKDAWSGTLYGLSDGFVSLNMDFSTNASSFYDIYANISGDGNIAIENAEIKGWNLAAIYDDLETRKNSDNLVTLVQDNLSKGTTTFENVKSSFVINNGAFVLENVNFAAQDYDVAAVLKGDLNTWNLDSAFDANVKNVNKVSQFSFEFDGDLSAPMLSVDVSKISGFYEDKLKKKADAIKAVEDARINKYKKLTDEQHKKAVDVANRVQNGIIQKISAYRGRAENKKIKEYYEDVYKQASRQSSLINEVVSESKNITFDDDAISGFQERREAVEAELPKILENLHFVHDQDVRMRVNERFLEVISKSSNLKEYEALFIDVEGAAGKRLANINTKYSLKDDTEAEDYKKKVNLLIDEITESVDYAKNEMKKVKDESDLDVWEDVFDDFEFRKENLTAKRKDLEKVFDEYKDYVEKKVAEEEKKYQQAQGIDTSTPEERAAVGKISKAGGKTRVIKFSTD